MFFKYTRIGVCCLCFVVVAFIVLLGVEIKARVLDFSECCKLSVFLALSDFLRFLDIVTKLVCYSIRVAMISNTILIL